MALIVLSVVYQSLPKKKSVSSVVTNHVGAVLIEIGINVALVCMLADASRKRRYVQMVGLCLFWIEHIRQYLTCVRTQTRARHFVTLLMEAVVMYDALAHGDIATAALMCVGCAMHLISIVRGGTSFLTVNCVT